MATRDRLPEGLYEHPVTEALAPRLQATEGALLAHFQVLAPG